MPDRRLARLRHEVRRIVGASVPDLQLEGLIALNPLTAQIVDRYFQSRMRRQLRKGQSAQVAQALDAIRTETAAGLPATPSARDIGDPDLESLSTQRGKALARVLRHIVHEVHFDQVNRDLRLPRYGGDYDIRPFPLPGSPVDVHEMKVRLRSAVKVSRRSEEAALARRIQSAFALFMFGLAVSREAVEELFGRARIAAIDDAFAVGLFVCGAGGAIRVNGLSLFSRALPNGEVVHLFADTPPHFETRAAEQRVYAGADSFELMADVSAAMAVSGVCVEMGSGSGIQLIAALKQHPGIIKAIGRERDRRAVNVSLFNAALNGVGEKFVVAPIDDALAGALGGQAITFAMTNPPFLAMPAWIDLDAEDCVSLRGLIEIRQTAHGGQGDLRTVFPAAGWGGDDGLTVTKAFLDELVPFLADDGRMVIYSQFAGDSTGPSVLRDYIQRKGGLGFAFEPVQSRTLAMQQPASDRVVSGESRTVLTATEAAISVARLIVAALLVREDPDRVRLAIRKGGREDAWQMKFAARLDEHYRQLHVTHFHDGFVVLTKSQPQ
jgi:methylase of polypeptide subunit release factors